MRLRLGAAVVLAVLPAGCGAVAHRAARPATPSQSLQRQLQLYAASAFARPRVPVHPRVITVNANPGTTCYVATRGGPCSLTPCIVPVQAAVAQAAPVQAPALGAPSGRCPPGARTSQAFRVSGP